MSIKQQIVETGKKLASLKPESKALAAARQWWKDGQFSLYSNEDFDMLNGMVCEISAIENGWN